MASRLTRRAQVPPSAAEVPGYRSRKRLDTRDRQREILQKSIRYFARAGFEGTTRDLAEHIGIAQSLLYHYFPSKQALLEQVYEELYVRTWKPEWDEWLSDANLPLKERLTRFYVDYAKTIHRWETVRIFLFASLRDPAYSRRRLTRVRRKIYRKVIAGLLSEAGGRRAGLTRRVAQREDELAWLLHGGVFYHAIRRHVLSLPTKLSLEDAVSMVVTVFLEGARAYLGEIGSLPPTAPREVGALIR